MATPGIKDTVIRKFTADDRLEVLHVVISTYQGSTQWTDVETYLTDGCNTFNRLDSIGGSEDLNNLEATVHFYETLRMMCDEVIDEVSRRWLIMKDIERILVPFVAVILRSGGNADF